MDALDDQDDVSKPDQYVTMRHNGKGCKPRIISSKPIIVMLLINSLLDSSYYSALPTLLNVFGGTAFKVVGLTFFVSYVVPLASPLLFFPLAGWAADACLGRHRTIQFSLWAVATGQVIVFVMFLLLPAFQVAPVVEQVSVYVQVTVALVYVFVSVGFAGLQTNVIPFCMDQMAYASGDQLSALIHWYYWTSNVKSVLVVGFDCLSVQSNLQYYTIQFGVNACLMGLALLIWHAWNPKFSIEPRGKNPVGTVCGVLAFASRHKYPRFQSALTSERPSRLELCKSGYGGPFTTEEVEDVKSFFRITVVLLSLGTFVLVDYAAGSSFDDHIQNRNLLNDSRCSLNTLLSNVWETAPIFLGIPLYEFIVHPLLSRLCRVVPSTLQAMGIGMLMAVASVVSFMSIDLTGHYLSDNATCFLNDSVARPTGVQLPVSSYLLTLPFLLGTLADIFTYIAAFQFICAQAPYNMRGMLFGVFYSITGLFALLSGIIDLSIMYSYKYLIPSCGTIYFASMTLIGVLGFVAFVLVATKYRRRERLDQGEQNRLITSELSVN